ncbi:DUF1129 family protein [Lactovum odontotermitis]
MKKKNTKTETAAEELPKISYEEGLASLTSKNTDYIHDVHRLLSQTGRSDDEIKTILEEILPEILEAQKSGVTARVLKGTPTEFTAKYKPKAAEKAKKETNKNPYLMLLDSFLLVFAILGALFGISMEFQKSASSATVYGLTALILCSIIAAFGMYTVYRQQSKTEAESGEKISLWQRLKPTIQLIGFFAVIYVVLIFSAFLPRALNPLLDGITMIILAVIAFGIRFLLKRKYNIQSSFTSRLTQDNTKK